MLHTKFQVSSRPGKCFSKIQIWPKSAVNRVLNVYRPGKCLFSLLGFEFKVMWGCFSDVFGLPYMLASLLIIRDNNITKVYKKECDNPVRALNYLHILFILYNNINNIMRKENT